MPEMPPMIRSGRKRIEVKREADQRRGSARERGYGRPWQKARDGHLRNHPLCFYCEAGAWGDPPRVTAATLVDHFWPHQGDTLLFWDKRFWCSCCADCHNGPKQRVERLGFWALTKLAVLVGLPTRG